jgi:hypothetical protein
MFIMTSENKKVGRDFLLYFYLVCGLCMGSPFVLSYAGEKNDGYIEKFINSLIAGFGTQLAMAVITVATGSSVIVLQHCLQNSQKAEQEKRKEAQVYYNKAIDQYIALATLAQKCHDNHSGDEVTKTAQKIHCDQIHKLADEAYRQTVSIRNAQNLHYER